MWNLFVKILKYKTNAAYYIKKTANSNEFNLKFALRLETET